MKVALVLFTAGKISGGVAKHLRHVAPLLAADPRISDLRVFAPEGAIDDPPAGCLVVEWPSTDIRRGHRWLRGKLEAFSPDVVFIPTARWLPTGGLPTAVMVRNMEPLETPFAGNGMRDRLRNLARRFAARRACRKADRIVAVSGHVRDFLTSRWGMADDRIAVVYHGVEPPLPPARPAAADLWKEDPFIFTAGSIRPARGLTDLISALADERIPAELRLVIAGAADAGAERYRDRVLALAKRLGVADRILWTGRLSPAEMSWCFRNARLFVTTSRAEACPNTVLEAMSHGSLSVSGDNAPMPEFFADAALHYQIGEPSSLADTIVRALALTPAEEARLRERGLARATSFTWERTAATTVEVLADVVSSASRGIRPS